MNLKISVVDTGAGISKEGMSQLFVDFNKLHENSNLNKQGTGLGLSICKKVIEQMGGGVTVNSEQTKGSIFSIDIKTKGLITEFN